MEVLFVCFAFALTFFKSKHKNSCRTHSVNCYCTTGSWFCVSSNKCSLIDQVSVRDGQLTPDGNYIVNQALTAWQEQRIAVTENFLIAGLDPRTFYQVSGRNNMRSKCRLFNPSGRNSVRSKCRLPNLHCRIILKKVSLSHQYFFI